MSPEILRIVLIVAAVAAGISSGAMFVFSNFVMPALGRLPARDSVRAMQAINENAINPLFIVVFIGTGFAMLGVSIVNAIAGGPNGLWLFAGTAIYMLGVVFVTAGRNVPLNNALANVDAEESSERTWSGYARPWVAWNHVRTVAGAAASAAFILAAIG